jgi:hypothetical protein
LTKLSKILFVLSIVILSVSLFIAYKSGQGSRTTDFIPDTAVITRYEKTIARDTVIKFTDRFIYKYPKPEKIYMQKTDTVFLNRKLSYDLPLRIEKENGELKINTINFLDSTFKEYLFKNTGGNFTLNAAEKKLLLKTRNFGFDKPSFGAGIIYPSFRNPEDWDMKITAETGFSFREKAFLILSGNYYVKEQRVNLSLSLKFKPL